MRRRNEQQEAADQNLEEAVRVVATAYGFGDDSEYIGDWMVVVELPQLDGSPTKYAIFTPGVLLPEHRARGLIPVATAALDEIYGGTDDEDED